MVGSVVPETTIVVAIMLVSSHVLDCVLTNGEIQDMGHDVQIQTFLTASTAFGAVAFDVASFGVVTFIKGEANTMDPSVVGLIFNEDLELNVTVVSEIDEFNLEEVPVIESEVVGVHFLVEVQPGKRRGGFLLVWEELVVAEFADVGRSDFGGRFGLPVGFAEGWLYDAGLFFDEEEGQGREEDKEPESLATTCHDYQQ